MAQAAGGDPVSRRSRPAYLRHLHARCMESPAMACQKHGTEDGLGESSEARSCAVPQARPVRTGHPLGPLVRMVPLESRFFGRLYGAGVAAVAAAVLVTAARLTPAGTHLGTHRQLGLPPCGFVVTTGLPCPTCGMTTAFSHVAHGRLIAAAKTQLAGAVLAVLTATAGVAGLGALVFGRRPAINWYRVNPVGLMWAATGLFVGAWAIKLVGSLACGVAPTVVGASGHG